MLIQELAIFASDIMTPMILERLASGRKASFKKEKRAEIRKPLYQSAKLSEMLVLKQFLSFPINYVRTG